MDHNVSGYKRLKRILNERCDGNRNILHAAVYICAPTSNNDVNFSNQQRTNKFSSGDSAQYSDIYATYGSTPSSAFLSSSSSSNQEYFIFD